MVPELNFDRTSRLIQYARIGNFLWLHLPYLGHQVHYQTFSNQSQNLPHIYSIHFALSLFLPQFRDYCPLQLPCLAPWPAGCTQLFLFHAFPPVPTTSQRASLSLTSIQSFSLSQSTPGLPPRPQHTDLCDFISLSTPLSMFFVCLFCA